MLKLTLEIYIDGNWQDAASIMFPRWEERNLREVRIQYLQEYLIAHFGRDDHAAASINYPVSFEAADQCAWPTFFDDIIPSGASRRYWVEAHELQGEPEEIIDITLLKYQTISPVGNLRIKESVDNVRHIINDIDFSIEDVANRASDFLDYARESGALAGGATGAGGEAPKFLVREKDNGRVWIDALQEDANLGDRRYLVKFPRNKRKEIDCNILRAEKYFYEELNSLGFNTIDVDGMRLFEGQHYPSLWLPRFDVFTTPTGELCRYGVESVYSMLRKKSGVYLKHGQTIRSLIEKIEKSNTVSEQGYHFDRQRFVTEWVVRDLLNIIFGNSDNHGRNTAFLKGNGEIKLAPIYDFAPMKADPEGVQRTITWGPGLELGGQYNFEAIAESLADIVAPEKLLDELRRTAESLVGLKERLANRGVPDQILNFPSIGFKSITQNLADWRLI